MLLRLEEIQEYFKEKFDATDIISGSKFYEIIIANELNHEIIPGQSGTKDAKDEKGEYEYKHYKEQSSNHSWTFNDYSETTIPDLKNIASAIFAHIDTDVFPPKFDWYIEIDGKTCSEYLDWRTKDLLHVAKIMGRKANDRKMINISPIQLEKEGWDGPATPYRTSDKESIPGLSTNKTYLEEVLENGKYYTQISEISELGKELEKITGVEQILTGDKIWEVLVAVILNHKVFSEQKKHDAEDDAGNLYEYKICKYPGWSWNFQDISDAVLKKYEDDKEIILARADKKKFKIEEIYSAKPHNTIPRLEKKLEEKKERKKKKDGKSVRRLSVSLSKGDLEKIKAVKIFPR